jgi:dCMP deaminase
VAEAARLGIALEDAELGVTTFPCLYCAKLVAEAGFKTCYFRDEYSNRDAELILRSAGVTLVQVTP